jgi:hypothetical protein
MMNITNTRLGQNLGEFRYYVDIQSRMESSKWTYEQANPAVGKGELDEGQLAALIRLA